ncbi:hypothetical protein [Moraxella phage Mcat20]|nr:hypothetical protein [Moraxella phage Mcat20]
MRLTPKCKLLKTNQSNKNGLMRVLPIKNSPTVNLAKNSPKSLPKSSPSKKPHKGAFIIKKLVQILG